MAKKVKVTGTGKLKRRASGQNHYNSRNSGDETRAKRKDQSIFKTEEKNIKRAIPYAWSIAISNSILKRIVWRE